MAITQIDLGTRTYKLTNATGAITYVNKYNSRLTIASTTGVVTINDFKDNDFDLMIASLVSPTFTTVGELVAYLTNNSLYGNVPEWYSGDEDPDATFGINGDCFLNKLTGDVWTRILGTWTLVNTSASGGSQILKGTAAGTDTYTTTIAGVLAYNDGDAYLIRFTNGNTTGCTLDINGLGAIDLYRNNDGALLGGDIWDGAEMLCIYNSTTNAFQCIGTSPNALYAYVTNADSVTITKGMVVYAYGGVGDRMTVKRAVNTSDATSAQTVGVVVSTSIAANQKGIIITQGLLDGLSILPTATYTDGDQLYLGSTAGSFTNVKPYAPNHLVYVAIVTTASNGSAGRMYVKVQNGYELDELHDVQAQSPADKDTLYYDNATSQWKTAQASTLLSNAKADGTTKGLATFTAADFNDNGSGLISIDYTNGQAANGSTKGFLTSADWTTFNGKVSTSRAINTTSPITGGGDLSADRTIAINNAKADGSTKGAATFKANDFDDDGAGLISIDYTNGQAASASVPGFLTAANFTTFNNKISGKAYVLTTDQTAVTGSTTNTKVYSMTIPANTVTVGTVWNITYRARKTGTSGTTSLRIYANTADSLTSATLIGTNTTGATTLTAQMQRTLVIKTATNSEAFPAATSGPTDMLNATVAASALNIDWTVTQYIIFAIQNANNADSTVVSYAEFKNTY